MQAGARLTRVVHSTSKRGNSILPRTGLLYSLLSRTTAFAPASKISSASFSIVESSSLQLTTLSMRPMTGEADHTPALTSPVKMRNGSARRKGISAQDARTYPPRRQSFRGLQKRAISICYRQLAVRGVQ